jgi:hypothetical protein
VSFTVKRKFMHIEEALAKMVMQLQPVEELSAIAAEALCAGIDSPSLRMLAGSSSADSPGDRWELLLKAARELGLQTPDKITAAHLLLRVYLKDIAEERVTPARGVENILNDIYHPIGRKLTRSYAGDGFGIERLLGDYFTYDDAASGRLEFRGRRVTKEEAHEILDRSILDEARKLLQEAEPGASPNDGPTTAVGNSRATEGPPSVS